MTFISYIHGVLIRNYSSWEYNILYTQFIPYASPGKRACVRIYDTRDAYARVPRKYVLRRKLGRSDRISSQRACIYGDKLHVALKRCAMNGVQRNSKIAREFPSKIKKKKKTKFDLLTFYFYRSIVVWSSKLYRYTRSNSWRKSDGKTAET